MRISDWSSDVCSSDLLIELEAQLHEKGVTLSTTPAARDWLARNGFDPLMGARPMARLLQDKIKRPLADELLFGKLVNGGRVGVDAVELGRAECWERVCRYVLISVAGVYLTINNPI